MSISIECIRGLGDNKAPEIIDPLLNAKEPAIARGTALLNKEGTQRIINNYSGVFTQWVRPGLLVRVVDADIGVYTGRVLSMQVSVNFSNDIDRSMQISIEREV